MQELQELSTAPGDLPCPVCENPSAALRCHLTDRVFRTTSERVPLYECHGCGLLFLDPGRLEKSLAEYYPPGYWWDEGGRTAVLEGAYRKWMVARDHLRFVSSSVPSPAGTRLLDIGCGSGLFVRLAAAAGFDAFGLETSHEAVAAARRMGVSGVIEGTEESLIESGETYDLITLFHTLEHIPEPFRYLRRIQKLLKKPGLLVVQVPNRASFQARLFGWRWYGLDCPRHVCNYSTYAVLYLLGRCGFRIRRVRHFSLRDNAAAMVSSAVPRLDPTARRVNRMRRGLAPRRWYDPLLLGVYSGLFAAAQPLAWLEAKLGRGGSVMVLASWDT